MSLLQPVFYLHRLSFFAISVTAALVVLLPHTSMCLTNGVTDGPQGPYPYLMKGVSGKSIIPSPPVDQRYPWKILRRGRIDTTHVLIKALRVEFRPDSSELTTGDGLFGISREKARAKGDTKELDYYRQGVYKYDNLPHGAEYFAAQLQFVKDYYRRVSQGAVAIDYEVFPRGTGYDAYSVPEQMTKYSPGAKKPKESFDAYYLRRTRGLIQFVADAITAADKPGAGSPFSGIAIDSSSGSPVFIDTLTHQKVIFLLIHAGASYLTNAGPYSGVGQDTPSDMIDAFISTDFFTQYCDTVETIACVDNKKHAGVWVNGANGKIMIDEIMMVSETSNQDSTNWGIHGILVNQVARQLGIPDLFSTMSGVSAVGAFCIMDFAGYSAGRGFIPPWPSAWVRAFMGWDIPVVAEPGSAAPHLVKAISTRNTGDTTILLVPINDHEYYLIENRQRNLSGNRKIFNYDTTDNTVHLLANDHVNLPENVLSTLGGQSKVIDSVKNLDVGLPASGVLVWHIDEQLIRDRLAFNVLNADSLYRAVNLVEADGVTDLGVTFQDAFYQAAFDYGGAEDVFPHQIVKKPRNNSTTDFIPDTLIASIGPFTRPSTSSNDGGLTYLSLGFAPAGRLASGADATERSAIRSYYINNYVDSVYRVTVSSDNRIPGISGWPRRTAPGQFYDPVACDLYANGDTLEIAAIDRAGRLSIFPAAGSGSLFARKSYRSIATSLAGDTIFKADSTPVYDTAFYYDTLPAPVSMPTAIGSRLYLPCNDSAVHVLRSILPAPAADPVWDIIKLPAQPSSYVCNFSGDAWAIGCSDGSIVFGNKLTIETTRAPSDSARSPITALALISAGDSTLAAIHANGILSVVKNRETLASLRLKDGYPPYTLATADLNRLDADHSTNIVVVDSRQGLWLCRFAATLSIAQGWDSKPLDWAGAYYNYSENPEDTARFRYAVNASSPALADIDANGTLDIILGGTNGVYAFSPSGALLNRWPALLDNRYWYQRGVVANTPAIGANAANKPMVLFSAPTGRNVTFAIAKIDSTVPDKGKVFYYRLDALGERVTDSITGLTSGFIDSLVIFGDSLILPYVTPGGFVDALDQNAKRPTFVARLYNTGDERQSWWPLTTGGPPATGPMLCDVDANGRLDIITITKSGWAYRWEPGTEILSNTSLWPQTGFNGSRTFAYGGQTPSGAYSATPAIKEFYNYPNPARDEVATIFRYDLTAPAEKVRLDIYTYTGYHVLSATDLPREFGLNEYTVPLQKFGSAVYRCRLETTFANSSPSVKYWKMAVVNK
jgi:hypothetical protein